MRADEPEGDWEELEAKARLEKREAAEAQQKVFSELDRYGEPSQAAEALWQCALAQRRTR